MHRRDRYARSPELGFGFGTDKRLASPPRYALAPDVMSMTTRATLLVVALLVWHGAVRLRAHHHVGCVYDTSRTETVTGRVLEIAWKFPHVHIRIDAATAGEWDVETANPQGLREQRIESDTLKVGDVVTAVVWRAPDGSKQAYTRSMSLSNGKTITFTNIELACPPELRR
jgi:hypothetical protein